MTNRLQRRSPLALSHLSLAKMVGGCAATGKGMQALNPITQAVDQLDQRGIDSRHQWPLDATLEQQVGSAGGGRP
jgi:hypothetical protein